MIPSKFLALTADYAVSGHKPPRPPIDLRPVWPPSPPSTLEEIMYEDMRRVAELARGERVWQVVVDVARSTNVAGGVAPMPSPKPPLVVEAQLETEVFVQSPGYIVWAGNAEPQWQELFSIGEGEG